MLLSGVRKYGTGKLRRSDSTTLGLGVTQASEEIRNH